MKNYSTGDIELASLVSGLTHQSERSCRFHFHKTMEIVYNLSGVGKACLSDNSVFHLRPGSVVIYWPGVEHKQIMEKTGTDVCILLAVDNISWLPENRKWLKADLANNSFLKGEILNLGRTRLNRNAFQQRSSDLRATALLADLTALAFEEEDIKNPELRTKSQVLKARNYIQNNFNTILSVRDVAAEVNISYEYLRHQFRDIYGVSMKKYLEDVRMKQVVHFLLYSPLPLKRISQECGFDNVRYFNTCFKRSTGLTPGEYRKKYSEI